VSLMVGCKKGRCMTQLLSYTQHVRRMAPWAKQRIKGSSAARNNTDLSGVVDVVADMVLSALLQSFPVIALSHGIWWLRLARVSQSWVPGRSVWFDAKAGAMDGRCKP